MSIVEDFDVVKHGVGEFELRLSVLAVEQFILRGRPEALHYRVIERGADGAEGGRKPSRVHPLIKGPQGEPDPMVSMGDVTAANPALRDGQIKGVHDELSALSRADGPVDDASAAHDFYAVTKDIAFSSPLFRDVEDPELVEVAAGECALDEIITGGNTLDALYLGRARKPSIDGIVHQDADQVEADLDDTASGQFSVDALSAVGATRGVVDLLDRCGEPIPVHHGRATTCACGRRRNPEPCNSR